ncbi:unnamed protein product [Protopolystoma xenopodis]|uniref:Uncharacterized protein n=1 Tax=Protopolystoma xenopodis TaxID=117903 RepID=A0A448WPE7_9PLAT|nr:unnamed protein product [Protopolystoma xenopodis]
MIWHRKLQFNYAILACGLSEEHSGDTSLFNYVYQGERDSSSIWMDLSRGRRSVLRGFLSLAQQPQQQDKLYSVARRAE